MGNLIPFKKESKSGLDDIKVYNEDGSFNYDLSLAFCDNSYIFRHMSPNKVLRFFASTSTSKVFFTDICEDGKRYVYKIFYDRWGRVALNECANCLRVVNTTNVVKAIYTDCTDDELVVCMEHVGDDILELTAANRLSMTMWYRVMKELYYAVTSLHNVGYSHNDIKMENVCVTRDLRVTLIDLGLIMPSTGKRLNLSQIGTHPYVAPLFTSKADTEKFADKWGVKRTNEFRDIYSYALLMLVIAGFYYDDVCDECIHSTRNCSYDQHRAQNKPMIRNRIDVEMLCKVYIDPENFTKYLPVTEEGSVFAGVDESTMDPRVIEFIKTCAGIVLFALNVKHKYIIFEKQPKESIKYTYWGKNLTKYSACENLNGFELWDRIKMIIY